jgi:WD and tetratricopeptide repeat-containing protein 1
MIAHLDLLTELEGHTGCVNRLAWNASGTLLASGSDDRCVRIWDYQTHKSLLNLPTGHRANIFGVAFSADDQK